MQQVRFATHWQTSSCGFHERQHAIAAHLFGPSPKSVWPAQLLERLSTLWARTLTHVRERRAASELHMSTPERRCIGRPE